jgi:hypothetical protein
MYRKFRRAAEERAGARIPTRTENDRGAEADELGRQVRPNSCGAGSEHARRRVAASPSRMTARPRWAPVLRDQPASAVSTYDHLVPDPRVATPVNGSRLPEPNRSCAKTATAPGLIPVCTPAVSTRGRQYQYDLQGFRPIEETGFEPATARPPAGAIQAHWVGFSALQRVEFSELASVCAQFDPRTAPRIALMDPLVVKLMLAPQGMTWPGERWWSSGLLFLRRFGRAHLSRSSLRISLASPRGTQCGARLTPREPRALVGCAPAERERFRPQPEPGEVITRGRYVRGRVRR